MSTSAGDGLGRSAANGALIMGAGQAVRLLVQLVSLIVLARLLSPADFGLLAMVLAILTVGEVVRDFGLVQAAVQAPRLTGEQRDNLFWVNSGIGTLLALALLALAGPVSVAYGQADLFGVVSALAAYPFLNGLAAQYRASLNRDLRFVPISLADAAGSAVGLAVAVVLALLGFGFWSLVFQQLAFALVALLVLVIAGRWRPRGYHRGTSIKHFVSYGSGLLGVQLLNAISRNVDSVVIGIRFGPAALGFYDRAFQIFMLPLNQINAPTTKVALPVLSRLVDDRKRFDSFLITGQSAVLHIVTFVLAIGAANADAVVTTLMGAQWSPVVPLFQVLAVAGFAQAASYATYWVFLSTGRTGSNLRFALASRPVLVAFVLIGSLFGVIWVAAAYSAALLVLWLWGLWWVRKVAPSRAMLANGLRVGIGNLIPSGVSLLFTTLLMPTDSVFWKLLIGALTFLLTWALVILLWPRFRGDLRRSVTVLLRRGRMS